jgi:hypothetical protein
VRANEGANLMRLSEDASCIRRTQILQPEPAKIPANRPETANPIQDQSLGAAR